MTTNPIDEARGLTALMMMLLTDEQTPPDNPMAWSEERFRSHAAASKGLKNGDLSPLASHVRAGFPIDRILAEELAEAIEGQGGRTGSLGYTLRLVGRTRSQRTYSERHAAHLRKLRIALFVNRRRTGRRGEYAGIILEAREHFGTKDKPLAASTVTDSLAYYDALISGRVADKFDVIGSCIEIEENYPNE